MGVWTRVMLAVTGLLVACVPAWGKTLLLEGSLASRIHVSQQVSFAVTDRKESFTYRYFLPSQDTTLSTTQKIGQIKVDYDPEPAQVKESTDRFGNRARTVTWKNLQRDARVRISYEASLRSELRAMESKAPYPLRDVPVGERHYLEAAEQVQSTHPDIVTLAKKLTSRAVSEHEAVTAIMRHVANAVTYTYNPPRYDALYALESGSGNCQNYAHLALALLRAAGIPGRVVGGYTLKDSWKIPVGKGASLVQSMGQGGHAWLEIYFPDLGWLSYDPQQSMQFTSTRHIKQTHGLQVKDIVDTWRATPPVPQYAETLDASFLDDDIKLKLTGQQDEPHGFLASNLVKVAVAPPAAVVAPPPPARPETVFVPVPVVPPPVVVVVTPPPVAPVQPPPPAVPEPAPVPPPAVDVPPAPVAPLPPAVEEPPPPVLPEPDRQPPAAEPPPVPITPPPVPVEPPAPAVPEPERLSPPPVPEPPPSVPQDAPPVVPKPAPAPGATVTFGNVSFPTLVEVYETSGDTGTRILDRETAEYVTSRGIYAQAFRVEHPMAVDAVSLAMKKFGGDGTVYVDIVADDNGKPALMNGVRSLPVYLEKVRRTTGYGWIDFTLPPDLPPFLPGKYWIVLRHSGEAIMNWFFIPGKRYGDAEDTRSTVRGWQWEDILNYDFVFRVSGTIK